MRRILFVDDDPSLLRAFRRTFAEEFEVITSDGAQRALEELNRARVDGREFSVIVSDLAMPRMNGATFFRSAREVAPRTVQVLLTGTLHAGDDLSDDDRNTIYRVVAKPCESGALYATIDAAIAEYDRRPPA